MSWVQSTSSQISTATFWDGARTNRCSLGACIARAPDRVAHLHPHRDVWNPVLLKPLCCPRQISRILHCKIFCLPIVGVDCYPKAPLKHPCYDERRRVVAPDVRHVTADSLDHIVHHLVDLYARQPAEPPGQCLESAAQYLPKWAGWNASFKVPFLYHFWNPLTCTYPAGSQ